LLEEKLKNTKIKDKHKMEQLIEEIYEKYNPCTIILHGSATKGGYVNEISDIDLIVVSEKFEKIDMEDRFVYLLEISQRHDLRAEIFGYTKKEFLKMIENINFFILDAIFYGLVLKDDENFWDKIIDKFKEAKAKYCLQKTETNGWKFKNDNSMLLK
jgi:predicted nucleotidyltransferase